MLFLILAFLILRPTLSHYILPPSSCLLSKFCNHTWTPECGQETLQNDTRMFLDLCDMHEYNCGKKKDYKEVDIKECPKDDAITTDKETSKHPVEKTTVDTEKTSEAAIENPKSASVTSTTEIVSTIITSPTLKSTTITSSKTAKDPSKCTCSTQSSATQSTVVTPLTTDSTVSSSSSTHTSANVTTTISVAPSYSECTRYAKPINVTEPINSTDTTVITESTEKIVTKQSTEETVTSESIEETVTTASITENTEPTNKDTDDEIDTITDNTVNTEVTEIETIIGDEIETEVVETSPPIPSHLSIATCSSYPKDCDRPHTWETTPYGEKRDFFQILRERFGNKVKILRATTHWPRRVLVKNQGYAFYNGRHRDINFK